MALFLKVSNSLDSLSSGLAADLQSAGNGVFQPHYIITQTEGMNNWLKLRLANHLGITANCRFLKPNDLLYLLYVILGGPHTEVLSPQNLSWLVFKLLGQEEFIAKFPKEAGYYANSGPESDIKRMALAEKVADLFDQYQVYRPEMIQEWTNTDTPALASAKWQQWLWVKVKQLSGGSLPDRTIVGNFILDALRHRGHKTGLAARMPAIHLFGLSIITAYHVKILHELSAFIDVHFHIINPAPVVFWFDERNEKQLARWRKKGLKEQADTTAGNALLTGWGRVLQDSFGLFFAYDAFINAYEETEIIAPVPDTLLHKIQHDIFSAATDNRHGLDTTDITDGSLTINACYTVAREVEVLYNYLVHLIDRRRETLSPRDIVVMVSDIDAYAPYIKAVFNHAPYKFRYTIADESYTDNDNLFNALHAILTINAENFKAEAVMQLLDFSYIRQRFHLQDPVRIRQVVEAANIRFGIEGNKEDETHFVSWQYGIQRIMYGICMSGEEEYGIGEDSFFPLDLLEGSDAHELIRFCHFAQVLMSSITDRQRPRSIVEWVAYTERVLHNLVFEPLEEIDEDYTTLMKEFTTYNALNEFMSDKVAFDVFSHSFLETLTGTTRAGLFVNGGITFCSLIPMRSIPFKVVALMGLNYDKFPRRENKTSFNLMEQNRQRGDRNVKENDKHLFLETVLSAKDYLYISYIGKSAKDNTVLPPSALVDELIDYIEAGATDQEDVRPLLVTQQPLQGFSRKYAAGDDRLFSYLNAHEPAKRPVVSETKITPPLAFEEITLDEMVSFFRNPFKAYYNKVLGIYYNDEQILLDETEIFQLNKLQQWSVKNELLTVPADLAPSMQTALVKKGQLPLRNMAAVALQQVEEMVIPVRNLYEECTKGAAEKQATIALHIENSVLKGTIPHVFDDTLVHVSWSKNETKHLVEAYLRYLAGVAAGAFAHLCFISGNKKEDAFQAVAITQEEALRRLGNLINVYKAGFTSIAPFYPDFETSPEDLSALDKEKFGKVVEKKFGDNAFGDPDPYIMQEYAQGYFEEEKVRIAYLEMCDLLIAPLKTLLPAYYNKTEKQK